MSVSEFGEIESNVMSTLLKSHFFLGDGHEESSARTKNVMMLCLCSMVIETICGWQFGSIALVADGIHMGTHVTAFAIAAFAYSYAAKHAQDPRFVFGTGKVAELAAFTSAIILTIIGLLILYESFSRLVNPEAVRYLQAIPIAVLGLSVNIASGLLLMGVCERSAGDGHDHSHSHSHGHSHGHRANEYQHVMEEGMCVYGCLFLHVLVICSGRLACAS